MGKKLVKGKCVTPTVNKCKCDGGVAAAGKACTKNGLLLCVKCNKGKKLAKCVADAYKTPCALGSKKAVCGPCIKGYKSDGKHGCVKCALAQFKGDGNCDDENNNCGCKYDGGDCCGTAVKKAYCKECKCKDPNYKPNTNCKGKCNLPQYKGDGNCDDENN